MTSAVVGADLSRSTGVAAADVAKVLDYLGLSGVSGLQGPTAEMTYGDLVAASLSALRQTRTDYLRSPPAARVPPSFPAHVQIQTIAGCNAACVMCAMSSRPIRRLQHGRMSDELFAKIVDECAAHEACEEIALYLQNEPLLDADLERKVATIKRRSANRLRVKIVTNGSLLFEERIDGLLAAGLDAIAISLNAFTAETYRRVMVGLELEPTLENVELLLERAPANVLVTLTFMVTTLNEPEIEGAIEYWSARGVLCGAYGINTHAGDAPDYDALRTASTIERAKECFLPLDSMPILASGDVLLCCTDWGRRSIFGSVASARLEDVWHTEAVSRFRRDAIHARLSHPICGKCLGQTRVIENLLHEGGPGRPAAAAT